MEFARRTAAVPEAPEFLQIASIQNVDRHVGVVSDIQAALRLVGGEVHGDRGSDDVGVIADKLLGDETAFAGLAGLGCCTACPASGLFLSNT